MRIQITTPLTSGGVDFAYSDVVSGDLADKIAAEFPLNFVPLADDAEPVSAPPQPINKVDAAPAVDAPKTKE